MAFNAEQLNIIIAARTETLTKELEKSQRQIKRFESKTKKDLGAASKSFDALGAVARRLAPILAATFSIRAINNLTRGAAEIGKMASLAGTSTREFQRFAAGARTVGFDMGKTSDIIKDMNDRVGDFISTGGGPMKDFFENIAPAVGVTAEQFARLSGPEALQLYVRSLEKANLSQAEMTFYMEALASDSTALLPLLKNNGSAMRELGDEAEAAGRVLSDEAITAARDLEQQSRELSDTIKMQLTEAILTNKDELMSLVSFITETAIPAFSSLIGGIGDALRLYNLWSESGTGGPEVAQIDPAVRAEEVKKANELGGGDTSHTGWYAYDPETKTLIDLRNQSEPIAGVTAPADRPAVTRAGIEPQKPKGGGKASDPAKAVEDLKNKYRTLIGTLDDAIGRNQEFEDAQTLLTEALEKGAISQDQFNSGLELAKQRLKDAKFEASGLTEVMSTVQGSMENAFMGMIDGTQSAGDAFKSMARDIIKELYRVLVVQQLVGSFTSGGGGILGAVYGAVGGAAAGGVIQSGQPTVVGEHGRELFVPSQGGRVLSVAQSKDAISGGGNSVTVIQNNTFGSGVSRAEINSMLPKIVETTKAAVFDAQRRSVTGR